MARDPLAAVSTIATPQTRPIPGREHEQVRNNAGGYTFGKDLWTRLEDFIILGTTGGTYYVREDKLTADNAQVVFDTVAADGVRAVNLATEISTARPPRAPKNRPALFVLAAAAARGDADTRQAVKASLAKAARTTDHLATFFGYWKNLGGKTTSGGTAPVAGRAMRAALGSWFLAGDVDQVAWRACKARQRKTPAARCPQSTRSSPHRPSPPRSRRSTSCRTAGCHGSSCPTTCSATRACGTSSSTRSG
ncbi:hypothetical protein BJF79_03525 [Actinomadura sp. CNU-125]|uniref:TROVE domain-containing protein n=1 Tax=Actinomadura sp. CNU-125 TaxID=1904961 RepID=UPI000963E32B|nr:TROVE domain-containing protein [Actinomadura sp. CNU-125]OLT12983.1 hypothetical protein BJF79_03525 [Actinomadura sp. CNU-125]